MRAAQSLLAALVITLVLTSAVQGKKDVPKNQARRNSTSKGDLLRDCLTKAAATAEMKRPKGQRKEETDYSEKPAGETCVNVCSTGGNSSDSGSGGDDGNSATTGGSGGRRLAQFEKLMPMNELLKLPQNQQREYLNRMLLAIGATGGDGSPGNDDTEEELISFSASDVDTLQVTETAVDMIPLEDLQDFCATVDPGGIEGNQFFVDQIKKNLGKRDKEPGDPGNDDASQDIKNLRRQGDKGREEKVRNSGGGGGGGNNNGGNNGNNNNNDGGGRRRLLNADGSLGIELPERLRVRQMLDLMQSVELGAPEAPDGAGRRLQQDTTNCGASIPNFGDFKESPLSYECDGIMVKPAFPGYTFGNQYGQYVAGVRTGTFQSGKRGDFTKADAVAGLAITKLALDVAATAAEKVVAGLEKGCKLVEDVGVWAGFGGGFFSAPQATVCASTVTVGFWIAYGLRIALYPLDKIEQAAGYLDGIVIATESEAIVQNTMAIGFNQGAMQSYNEVQFTQLNTLLTGLLREVEAVKDAVSDLEKKIDDRFCSTQNQLRSIQNRASHLHSLLLLPDGRKPGFNALDPKNLLPICPFDSPIPTCGDPTSITNYTGAVTTCRTVPL